MSAACPSPLDLDVLVGYWFGEPGTDETGVEEHLLACAACSARLEELVALGEGVRRLAHEGLLDMVVGPSFLEAAARDGLRVREYVVPAGGRVACTVTPQDDLLVARLRGDFHGLERLDLVAQLEGGPEARVEDLPFAAAAGEVVLAQAMPAMRALGPSVTRLRLVAPGPEGDRLVGEYTFSHTPSTG